MVCKKDIQIYSSSEVFCFIVVKLYLDSLAEAILVLARKRRSL